MKATVFDGITRELGAVSSRRSFFHLLGGAAVVGSGVALLGSDKAQAKGKSHGKARVEGHGNGPAKEKSAVQAQGKKKTITICYQNQTRTVKKKGYQTKYPGATPGLCPTTGGTTGGSTGGSTQQPAACTNWIISGGPNQSDPIMIDDDGSILNVTTGSFLVIDNNGQAGPINPVVFAGKVGDVLRVRATDWGGCRSFSPLWVHCLATGQKKQLFTGYNGSGCNNPKGDFLDMTLSISL